MLSLGNKSVVTRAGVYGTEEPSLTLSTRCPYATRTGQIRKAPPRRSFRASRGDGGADVELLDDESVFSMVHLDGREIR